LNLSAQTYTNGTPVTINNPITINGVSGTIIEITTAGDQTALTINSSDVVINGCVIDHAYTTLGGGGTDTCIGITAGTSPIYPDEGALTHSGIEINNCTINYGKFGVSSKARDFTVSNSVIHCKVTTSTTARGIAVYSQDGTVNIHDNTYTTAGNIRVEGLHLNFATNDSYQNKRNGVLNYYNNVSNAFVSNRKFIFHEVGSEKGLAGDTFELNVYNNTIRTTGSSVVVVQPNSADSFEYYNSIQIYHNDFGTDTHTNGILQIDVTYGSSKTHNEFINTPIANIYNNVWNSASFATSGTGLEGVLAFTGYSSLPSNVSSFLSTSAPAPPPPAADPLVESVHNTADAGTTGLTVGQLIGGGSSNSTSVSAKKFSATSSVLFDRVFSSGSTSSTVRLVLTNAASIGYEKSLSVFPNTWRTTTGGYSSPIAFSIKFVDPSNLSSFVSNPGTQTYTISVPEIANRAHLKIYKENADGTATFVTDATKVTGESYLYAFSLTTNSVYTVADSGVMFASAGVGSDPHVTTLSGRHWVMQTIKGKNRDIQVLADKKHSITGHIQGYPNGEFMSKSVITENGKPVCEIDFQKRKIKIINDSLVKLVGKTDSSSVENSNNSNKGRQTLLINAFNPGGVLLYVDFGTRYLCPIFRQAIQNPDLKGLVV
jgi:hypothetical protein